MVNYFENITTLDELKKAYRVLAMKHHPDRGGDLETMKLINSQHDVLFETLKALHNADAAQDGSKKRATTETAEEFRDIIVELLKLDGLTVELCGSWLWIGGETKAHKDKLKALKCRWSSNKKLWYWHHEEAGRNRWRRRKTTIGEIRLKYGSTEFANDRGSTVMASA